MTRYIDGWDRRQILLLPECVDDYVDENNPVRVIEVFVGQLNLSDLGFDRAIPRRDRTSRLSSGDAAKAL